MGYLASAAYLDAQQIVKNILNIPKTGFLKNPNTGKIWSPLGVTWHNTSNPSLGLWQTWPTSTKKNWGNNLISYYKSMDWHAPPHAVGTPDGYAIQLGQWQADGVHSTCYNSIDFGIETVGNFVSGGDDPTAGIGLAAMQSSANIIAALCLRFNFNPDSAINFHRQCVKDNHACPGNLVTDIFAIGLVKTRISEIQNSVAFSLTDAPLAEVAEE